MGDVVHSGGVVASGYFTTNALGQATMTWADPGYQPVINHPYFFIDGLTLYVILPESFNHTTLTVRVWAFGVVTLLATSVLGVLPASNVPVYLEVIDP